MTSEGHPHASGGRPQSAGGPPPDALSGQGSARGVQFVKFSFYRVSDDLRRGTEADRLTIAKTIGSAIERSGERMLTRLYSTVGTRADTDFLIWQVADDLKVITDWHAELLGSPAGAALERPHSYLSMTMRSMYSNPLHEGAGKRERLRDDGGTNDYLFVYPMVKIRDWYKLPGDERQRIMSEHIEIGHEYHEIKINTTYSYGIDDQEFVVAFEGDDPGQFLALVRELRNSESSSYTERDTPMFTCRRFETAAELLTHLGLTPAADAS
ncbi:MAG TPA: chlorite dismutase family protein [Dehalococcoidia bacterium]|nr:chlorite dismutase family protein [Dehalococcoidia bacterium]